MTVNLSLLGAILAIFQLQESDKGQISYWSIHTCTRIMLLFVDRLWPCSKNLKTALFQTFSTWHPYTFCPYCIILTQYRLLVTQYHQVRVGQLIRHYQTETANSFLNQSVSFQNFKFWRPSCASFSQMFCSLFFIWGSFGCQWTPKDFLGYLRLEIDPR